MKLTKRGSTLYLRKRVPARFSAIEPREYVWISLFTDSEIVARAKAPAVWAQMLDAWEAKLDGARGEGEGRMKAARELAAKRGFRFMVASDVVNLPTLDLVERIEAVMTPQRVVDKIEAAALLGTAKPPSLTVSRALERFWEIGKAKTLGKSEDQIRRWRNPRIKAVKNFVEAVGDIPVEDVTTRHLHDFKAWWVERIAEDGLTANSANKDLIHLTSMLREVATVEEIGIRFATDRLMLREAEAGTRPPFSVAWIKDRLLAPGALDGLNSEARGIVLGMINTGYRPSEGAMLTRDQIRLDANVPHISIEPVNGRQLKTAHSRRVIPLVGVSLEAFRANPDGFPRYADNPSLSDTVNKYLRENKLLETPRHTLYSLRHAFEDRMLAAGIDERIRRDLFGHALKRERYGDGASLEHAQELLLAIAL